MATVGSLEEKLRVYEAQVDAKFATMAGEMVNLNRKITSLEEAGREGRAGREDGAHSRKSLIHAKMITPTVLSLEKDWKKWKGDIEEFGEESAPGMKEVLEKVDNAESDVDED